MMNDDQAHTIALQGLAYVMSEEVLALQFMELTGFNTTDIRDNAGAPEVLEAVLSVLAQDDSTLLTFATNAGLAPERVMEAYGVIAHGSGKMPLSYT